MWIQNLTGVTGRTASQLPKACQKSKYGGFYCLDSFFGPVQGEKKYGDTLSEEYYLSVMNPSNISLNKWDFYGERRNGYAFGLLDRARGHATGKTSVSTGQGNCVNDESRMVVNLGTQIDYVNATATGFEVSYIYGDSCVHQHGHQLYSSHINFVCDKNDFDGFPVFLEEDNCNISFNWRTQYACDICKKEDLARVEGSCIDGYRMIHLEPVGNCTVISSHTAQWQEECSITSELMHTTAVIAGLIVMIILWVVVAGCVFLFCNVKRKYDRLIDADFSAVPQSSEADHPDPR